jgi:hypothetical protein
MTLRTSGRTAGALFLAAFVLYGVGTALGPTPFGITLILLNSVAVVIIGLLIRRWLRPDDPRVAEGYLWARVAEGVLLAVGACFLAADRSEVNDLLYAAAMIALAAGSIPMLLALARLGLIPRWFAYWGAIGYALTAIGVILDFPLPAVGILFLVPGGLFEVAFGLLLVFAGFPTQPDPAAASRSR